MVKQREVSTVLVVVIFIEVSETSQFGPITFSALFVWILLCDIGTT